MGYYMMYYMSGIIILPVFIFALICQAKVKSNFKKYSRIMSRSNMTGADAAWRLLQLNGITDVKIQRIGGTLTDYYDPSKKVICLSSDVFDSKSIAAIGVACHEAGHAVQHAEGYAPLSFRNFVIPATAVNKIVQVVNEGYITKFAVAKAVVDAMSSYTTTVVVTNTVGAIEKAVEVNASTGTEQAIENASLADEVKNSENYRYQISTKEELATFRDAVNNGSTFEGLTVKLMNDITLDAGWAPIGAFKRGDVLSGSKSTFMGTFDGNGKTISNLTNAGYIPTALFNNESTFSEYEYTYGLFATTKNATIKNLTVNANINIPTSLGASITGECVGIIVGYAAGSLSLDGCVAKGSVSSYNNVGGLVGAIYATDTDKNVSIKNSTNEANVTSQSKAGGIVGFLNTSKGGIVANFVATVNKGNVTAYNTVDSNVVVAGGICAYGTNPFGGQSQITLLNVRNEGVVSASRASGNTGVIQANAFTISWQTAQSCAGFEGFTTFSNCVYTQKVVVSGTAQDSIKVDSVVGGSTETYAPNTIIG